MTANDCTAELSNFGEIASGNDIAGQCQTGAMSFYGDHVLPRLIDLLLRSSDTHELRARVAAGLTGESSAISDTDFQLRRDTGIDAVG